MTTKDTAQNLGEQPSETKSNGGGFVPRSDIVKPLYDSRYREWVKCKKCGSVWENYTNPPICFRCIAHEDNK